MSIFLINQSKLLRHIKFSYKKPYPILGNVRRQVTQPQTSSNEDISAKPESASFTASNDTLIAEIFPASRVVPMLLTNKEQVVLPFDDVPGPKSLKYLSNVRQYLSEIGTQITVSTLTAGLNFGNYLNTRKPLKNLSSLFEEYGPVVRFISPVGADIVFINHPDHIQKVYSMEGDCPVRSALDSLEKYRIEHRNHVYSGLFTVQGEEWTRQRSLIYAPLQDTITQHVQSINDICEEFTDKVYNLRNHRDEITKDLYDEINKWAFDCLGLIIFSKKFSMLKTEVVTSQSDNAWLYHSLQKATEAIIKCESGMQLWKLFATPSWNALVKHCDSLDNLIGKHVLETEQLISSQTKEGNINTVQGANPFVAAMLIGNDKMSSEDIATVLMDMLLIGVNTITSTMSFLMYYLARHAKFQKKVYQEIANVEATVNQETIGRIKDECVFLKACIKETLRLVPPIPMLTRILPRNITLDKYNIPRGTLIVMSTQESSLKESNFDEATKFNPERWLSSDVQDYHSFASIPFGHGARKCLAQSVAETMLSLLTIRLLQKYKLEYHYGDIQPTRSFIARPNRALKLRFIDRF